jgi:hypothetical protein
MRAVNPASFSPRDHRYNFRGRCNTNEYLLSQDCRPGSHSNLVELDGSSAGEVFISFLNSGLGSGPFSSTYQKLFQI